MFAEVDVFVGNNTLVDLDIYHAWLDGFSAKEAAVKLQQNAPPHHACFTLDLLISDVLDHYRTFQMLERYLHSPAHLAEQWTFQLSPETQKKLIEKYYEFDDAVVREFIGKKLSSRNRKELDEVSEKTGVNIKSCRRQFDNVKRVYKLVEDQSRPLIQNIKTNFLLSETLAKKYAAVSYMTNNRFETSKRKLQYLVFEDFLHCAYAMMSRWSCSNPECRYEETAMDLDREFLQELRELKVLLERDVLEEHKSIVLKHMKGKLSDRSWSDLDNNFKSFSRTLVNIAYGLNHSREVKDLFVDLVEKLIEPCKHWHWSYSEMQNFLDTYTELPVCSDFFANEQHLYSIWKRYMKTLAKCILQMYHY